MVTKEKVIASIEGMPKEFELDELFERLILIQKIEEGLDDVKNGQVISAEELLKDVKTWGK